MEASVSQPVASQETQVKAIKSRPNPPVFWKLVGFTIRDYLRSPWVFFNIAILVAVHALFFQYRSGQSHFFAIEYAATMLQAALVTAVMFSRSNRAETYALLARQVPRASYVGAIMLACWLIAVVLYLVSTIFDVVYFSELVTGEPALAWRTPQNYAIGSLAILVGAGFAVCLVALLTSFVSSSPVRLGIMTVIAFLVMSFDSRNFPVEGMRPFLQQLPPFLAPLAGALKFATEQDNIATISLLVLAAYTLLMCIAALLLSSNRELILD